MTTKVVPVLQWGPRTLEVAYGVVHELCQRMQVGHRWPVYGSDGLPLYFCALTAHCGRWMAVEGKRVWQLAVDFVCGQLKKIQRRRRLVKVEGVMFWGGFEPL